MKRQEVESKIGFFLMKCFLGLFALGDVGVGADDTNGIALFITYGSSARHYPTWGAIFVQHAMGLGTSIKL